MATSNLPSDYPGTIPDAERRVGLLNWLQEKCKMMSQGRGLRIFQGLLVTGVIAGIGVQKREAIYENIASVRGVSTAPKPADVERSLQNAGFKCTNVVYVEGEQDGSVVYLTVRDPFAISEKEIRQITEAMHALGVTSITLVVPNTNGGTPLRELSVSQSTLYWNEHLQWGAAEDAMGQLLDDEANQTASLRSFFEQAVDTYKRPMADLARQTSVKELAEENIPSVDGQLGFGKLMKTRVNNQKRDPDVARLQNSSELVVGAEANLPMIAKEFTPSGENILPDVKVQVLHVTRPNKNGE